MVECLIVNSLKITKNKLKSVSRIVLCFVFGLILSPKINLSYNITANDMIHNMLYQNYSVKITLNTVNDNHSLKQLSF